MRSTTAGLARPDRLFAAAAPLAVAGLAFLLWWISDRLLYIGPFDRATFGWAVVIPLWAVAPLVAGLAWRGLSRRARGLAAMTCGLAIGAPIAFLLWQPASFPACPTGSARAPIEWLLPAITLGAVVGGTFGLTSLIASGQVRAGHQWRALMVGAAGQVAVVPVSGYLAFFLFFGTCARP